MSSVDVPSCRVLQASAGPGEPVGSEATGVSRSTRLKAELSPRARLAITWLAEEGADTKLPLLLSAPGEIAIQVDPGAFRIRSSWSVRATRGIAKALQIQLGSDDELIDLEVDGQRPATGTELIGGAPRVTIPLAEPLGPGQERRLVLSTRRLIPTGSAARITFRGFPLLEAREQGGAIGIATTGKPLGQRRGRSRGPTD